MTDQGNNAPINPMQTPLQQPPMNQAPQYQAPQYQAPQGPPPVAPSGSAGAQPKNSKALAALICGILAVVLSPSVILGVGLGIAAMVLAILSRNQSKDVKGTIGFVCGAVGVVLSAVLIVAGAMVYCMGLRTGDIRPPSAATLQSEKMKSLLYEEVKGTVIVDDAVCTITIDKMEFDKDNNLDVYFTATNHTVGELDISNKTGSAWELNNEKVECVCFTYIKSKETKQDRFTIPAEYVPTTEIDEIRSLSGTIVADLQYADEMEYKVDLY